MYRKTILDTSKIKRLEFIITPHEHYTEKRLHITEIIHYHCWVNSRYKYKDNMKKIEILKNIKQKYKSEV